MSNIKKTLKEAREAINSKDYQATLKLCKAILKEDKDNYMALVFMGISLQEIGPEEQAPLAFLKATQLNPSNVLAWNGLANFYEKKMTLDSKQELCSIYIHLLELESNPKKVLDYIEKIIDLGDTIDKYKFLVTVQLLLKQDELDNIKNSLRFSVSNFLSECEDLPENLLQTHAEILVCLVTNSDTVSKKHYNNYLKVLYKLNDYEKLIEAAEKMQILYTNDLSSLEWICKVYVKLYIDNNELEQLFYEKAKNAVSKLLEEDSESVMGLLTNSILFYNDNNFYDARELLLKITNVRQSHLYGWLLLSMCEYKLNLYEDAIFTILKTDKLFKSTNSTNESLGIQIKKLLPELLSRSKEPSNWSKAIELCSKVENIEENEDMLKPLIRSYINLENFDEAQKWLLKLKLRGESLDYLLLKAMLLKMLGNMEESLKFLEENKIENYIVWLEIGSLYWDLELYEKSLMPYLKATKLNSNSYLCFSCLGQYYHKFNDLDKARRCYEKAFKLNNKSLEIGLELSNIYMKQKRFDANIIMLQNLTYGKATQDNSWALIQLGLSYYDQGDYNRAIDSFRLVIRLNSENSFCWECLGDAYIARGAYTSSLKSYQKSFEINPKSLYTQIQMASVKQMLGQLAEARSDFEVIVKENRTYVPALKGLAVTCLNQAKEYQKQQLWGLARDSAQSALDKLTIAIEQRSNISCLWKLAADCCYLVANLPERYCCMFVLSALAEGEDVSGNKMLEQDELYTLAERCYCKSMSLISENMFIWHDLARCYLSHARSLSNESSNELYQKAFAAIHHCVINNPDNWEHWNLLGVISFYREPKNFALAQHSFIKAVTIERNSATSWCNLGVLYLYLQDNKLANKAFAQAQRSDPTFVNSWIGQAFIAENLSPDDAMDLFRHSTQLTVHPESATSYGYWVCKTLLEAPLHSTIYSIHNMHAVPVACDALTWYTEKHPDDACAWNMLGLLRERMGLKMGAVQAFRSALRLAETSERDKVYINYGRSLIGINKHPQAVDMFKNVKEATFNSGSGLALALYKDKQYEESYASYESALHWLTDDQGFQSELLVALASMAYLFQGAEEAKTLLFQSFQLESPSPWGLYATLSLGLLHEDLDLAKLVLKELDKIKDEPKSLHHYSILLSYVYLLQGDPKRAVCELSKLVHRHPGEASLWLSLSILLIRVHTERPQSYAAAKCGEIAMKLGQTNMDVTKVLCIVSLGLYLVGDYEQALKSAQKAIHYYPNVAECWAVFISALIIKIQSDKQFAKTAKVSKRLEHIRDNLEPSAALKTWLDKKLIKLY